MMGHGAIVRKGATIRVGEIRDHIKNMNEETPIVVEMPDGTKMTVRAVSNPSASDLPMLVIKVEDDYTPTSLGF